MGFLLLNGPAGIICKISIIRTEEYIEKRTYNFILFYMAPPITQEKKPESYEFPDLSFNQAYNNSKQWIKTNCPKGSKILMLAQLDR